MIKTKTLSILAASGAGLLIAGQPANAALWDSGAGDFLWETPTNWADDAAPNGVAEINNGDTVTRAVTANPNRTYVNGGSTLNITAGSHADGQSGNTIRNFFGNNSAGTVNLSGASTLYDIGHITLIGSGSASGNGTFTQSDGSFIIGRGGNSFMGIAGGSSLEIGVGSATGIYSISGGSFASRIGVGVGSGGTFHVIGSGATSIGVGSQNTLDGSWNQAAGGILRLGFNGTGTTNILIDVTNGTGSGGGNAIFQSGAILDPYDMGSAVTNTWQTVMTWEGSLTDNGLVLSSAAIAEGWEKQVVGSDLQVRLVPEPSSAALLGLGGLALIMRRRK